MKIYMVFIAENHSGVAKDLMGTSDDPQMCYDLAVKLRRDPFNKNRRIELRCYNPERGTLDHTGYIAGCVIYNDGSLQNASPPVFDKVKTDFIPPSERS